MINPNSVKICRLCLWIELLKNAYHKEDSNYTELETIPNIGINIKCGREFVNVLKLKKNGGLRWSAKFYPGEVHETIPLNGQYDALKFLFDINQFKSNLLQINPEKYRTSVSKIDSLFITHFKKVSQRLGYTVNKKKKMRLPNVFIL